MIEYKVEKDPIHVMKDNIHLLLAHKEEISRYGKEWDLDPYWKRYEAMVQNGTANMISARKNGEIIGYTVNLIFRHLHYNFIMGYNDLIYMLPEYRGYGIRLIRETEKYMKLLGVDIFNISVKPHVDFRKVLEKFNYKFIEYEYARRL